MIWLFNANQLQISFDDANSQEKNAANQPFHVMSTGVLAKSPKSILTVAPGMLYCEFSIVLLNFGAVSGENKNFKMKSGWLQLVYYY